MLFIYTVLLFLTDFSLLYNSDKKKDGECVMNEEEIRSDGAFVFDEDDIELNRGWGIGAYFLFFLPLIAAKDSQFARFHANQSLLIDIVALACSLCALIPTFGFILTIVGYIALVIPNWFSCLFAAINGGVKRCHTFGQFNIIKL